MSKKNKSDFCCSSSAAVSCCKVESLISIDERGQMVESIKIEGIKPGA